MRVMQIGGALSAIAVFALVILLRIREKGRRRRASVPSPITSKAAAGRESPLPRATITGASS